MSTTLSPTSPRIKFISHDGGFPCFGEFCAAVMRAEIGGVDCDEVGSVQYGLTPYCTLRRPYRRARASTFISEYSPLPGTATASTASTSPPFSVQASPVAMPAAS